MKLFNRNGIKTPKENCLDNWGLGTSGTVSIIPHLKETY